MIQIDLESEFTNFVRSFGGEVLEDTYGTSLPFANADYYFRGQNIVGELKRLVDNKSEDENIREKIQAKFDRWMQDGRIPLFYGKRIIESSTLPEECQRELLDVFKPALRRRILKANKQIRETSEFLNTPDAKGLLFICNDGNYALEADAVIYLIGKVLGRNCSSINSVVYFTANMLASSPITEKQVLVWAHITRGKITQAVDPQIVMQLFDSWRIYLESLRNESIEALVSENTEIEHIRYDKI